MVRRTHKKSRNGCVECKRRHMKCDEKRPICSNCTSSQRHCEFVGPLPLVHGSRSASRELTTASPSVQSQSALSPAQTFQQPNKFTEDAPVNMLHVELLHDLWSDGMNALLSSDTAEKISFQDFLCHGLAAPYLMNELLSLSALHLSIVRPEKRNYYQHHSTQLQNYALNSFNAMSSHITAENTPPIFLFAAILGLHKLCETLVYRDDDFEGFLDRFVQYVRLHHGVRVVVGQGRWETLQQTNLKPFLDFGTKIPPLESTLGPVCQELLDRIKGVGLDDATFRIYQQAVQNVQSVMTIVEGQAPGTDSVNILVAWPILVPREYIDLISERRSEALVIFAYYGALVDTQKDIWLFRDGGEYLVRSISQYLGAHWEEWLRWPCQNLTGTVRAAQEI
ncbi:unnamed protein product [Penicillium salamii]|uniref:Zn(2)-C6 fungal-type domain-containing protein n=1 Tax=Penicillium salamii TaxID=1612424 RepID=A0A9W4ICC7_9EURO|nr:unnamed protein product [Penicillium salamii]CAG7960573.1 unnamed protein product [Penicillium salamii]CAG7964213.1 unnamed protein product [Penicillium salamii]CAG7982021.1 unnamed protein product [Penicillium salamii]CAG8126509.1 unnamed protein product [Penicillium salamii]